MPLGEKLRQFGQNKFGTAKALAEALGMEPGSFHKYLQGTRKPGTEILQKLLSFGCDLNWLLTDNDARNYENLEKEKSIQEVAKTYEDTSCTLKLRQYTAEKELYYFSVLHKYNYLYIVDSLSGKNMSPLINIGDNVITDTRIYPESGDLVLCKLKDNLTDEFRYIIRYYKEMINNNIVVFHGLNPEDSSIYIDMSSLLFVHKIVLIRYPVDGRL